jgi:hypothetical protein
MLCSTISEEKKKSQDKSKYFLDTNKMITLSKLVRYRKSITKGQIYTCKHIKKEERSQI